MLTLSHATPVGGGVADEWGDPNASAGWCEGLQEILADEIAEMKREALEKISRHANEGRSFETLW